MAYVRESSEEMSFTHQEDVRGLEDTYYTGSRGVEGFVWSDFLLIHIPRGVCFLFNQLVVGSSPTVSILQCKKDYL